MTSSKTCDKCGAAVWWAKSPRGWVLIDATESTAPARQGGWEYRGKQDGKHRVAYLTEKQCKVLRERGGAIYQAHHRVCRKPVTTIPGGAA